MTISHCKIFSLALLTSAAVRQLFAPGITMILFSPLSSETSITAEPVGASFVSKTKVLLIPV